MFYEIGQLEYHVRQRITTIVEYGDKLRGSDIVKLGNNPSHWFRCILITCN